ncbi:MAG TPA: hypothetical protein VJ746_13230 [Nitrospira sp.]|nr:hypothetical protein [Nitrospira sp.]
MLEQLKQARCVQMLGRFMVILAGVLAHLKDCLVSARIVADGMPAWLLPVQASILSHERVRVSRQRNIASAFYVPRSERAVRTVPARPISQSLFPEKNCTAG